MGAMKYGRKPVLHTTRTFRAGLVMARHLDKLGPAPTSTNDYVAAVEKVVGADWGMMGNDGYGDCVFADDAHQVMIITANTGAIVVPTTDQTLAQYSAETGFDQSDPSTDNGADETTDCQYLVKNGFLGHKASDTAMVDPTNLDHMTWTVQLFGAAKLGVNWTKKQMDQFNNGETITGDPNGEVDGGHDVVVVRRQGDQWWIVTFGKRVQADAGFIAAAEECHALLWVDWAGQGNAPSGFNLAALDADLKSIGQ